jgi:hypothetical protein
MSLTAIVCADGTVFHLTNEELKCSKFLAGIAGDLLLVTRVNLDRVPSEIMTIIEQFMKLAVNPPDENWLDNCLDEVRDSWAQLLDAAIYLEIEWLTDRISELIAKQIEQCPTIESVFLSFNTRSGKCLELSMISRQKKKQARFPRFLGRLRGRYMNDRYSRNCINKRALYARTGAHAVREGSEAVESDCFLS